MSADTCAWLDVLRAALAAQQIRAIDLAVGYQWLTRLYRHPQHAQKNMLGSAPSTMDQAEQCESDSLVQSLQQQFQQQQHQQQYQQQFQQERLSYLQDLQRCYAAEGVTSNSLSSSTLLLLAGVSASIALGRGQVCIELSQAPFSQWQGVWPQQWQALGAGHHAGMIQSVAPGRMTSTEPLSHLQAQGIWITDTRPSAPSQPVSINRFYLARYYVYEQALAGHLMRLSSSQSATDDIQWARVNEVLAQLFADANTVKQAPDWQKIAAATACTNHLSIITGGPGTGKTTTVTKILLALGTLFGDPSSSTADERQDGDYRIALVAPTGKAAARLLESVQSSVSRLKQELPLVDDLFAVQWPWHLIPSEATTIHRLLGVRQGGFMFNEQRQLPYDCLVIDEASMIDLPLMERLLRAVKFGCRVIMLGDEDQLASVEAGSVLADMVSQRPNLAATNGAPEVANFIAAVASQNLSAAALPPVSFQRGLAHLHHSYRFAGDSGIGQLADTINQGDIKTSWQLLQNHSDLACYSLDNSASQQNSAAWLSQALQGYGDYWAASQKFTDIDLAELLLPEQQQAIKQLFKLFSHYQILTAVREGLSGVSHINAVLEQTLRTTQPEDYHKIRAVQYSPIKDQSSLWSSPWYCGRPIMINRNDHRLGLYNGDIGITLGCDQQYRVAFIGPDGEVRLFLPSRLPSHDTAFAFTVHKSQGSEFAISHCILSDQWLPVMTRELLYTAVTRAKQEFWLTCSESTWQRAVTTQVQRASGLADLLQ